MGPIGPVSLVLIILAALLIFGPSKLPELGKAFGKTLREFKNATNGLADDDTKKVDSDNDQPNETKQG
ncbi:twin-arginine translocase TatA/TatE family subunit [Bacillus horti]|uniref:Sec-independent protein translocase protein TatA n=1 Tax=Caldalkalibacillus horti TaxID=77523 RepID=A0ABT9W4W1_9BACI|nr:twin-arginine translocase TatA/TatE family subunit [Bacillus horti]MDQ0168293.1 sec-independent protein translocase protein TatA [Bacillus horti]